MHSLKFLLPFLFMGTCALAQAEGKYLLGLDGFLIANEANLQASAGTAFGIFNTKRSVAGGLAIGYSLTDGRSGTINTFEVGPFFRSYFYRNTYTGLFIGGGISYGRGVIKGDSDILNTINFGPDLGFNVYVTPTAAIELSLGFRVVSQIGEDNSGVVFGSGLGFVLFL